MEAKPINLSRQCSLGSGVSFRLPVSTAKLIRALGFADVR